MKYLTIFSRKVKTPDLKDVLTKQGARLMALGAASPSRRSFWVHKKTLLYYR